MKFKELMGNFLPIAENFQSEVKSDIIQKLTTVLKDLNIQEEIIDGELYIKLKIT